MVKNDIPPVNQPESDFGPSITARGIVSRVVVEELRAARAKPMASASRSVLGSCIPRRDTTSFGPELTLPGRAVVQRERWMPGEPGLIPTYATRGRTSDTGARSRAVRN